MTIDIKEDRLHIIEEVFTGECDRCGKDRELFRHLGMELCDSCIEDSLEEGEY